MIRRAILVTCVLLASLLGCDRNSKSASTTSNENKKLVLQLNWKPEPQFGGFYVAPFDKHGIDVEVREGGAGAPTIDMLAAGTVPFAVVSGDEIVVARARGKKVVALFATYQTHPQGIMCRASRGFTKIDDIFTHDGTLAIEQGLGYTEFLKRKFGFDKLKIVPTPFGDLSFIRNDEKFAMQCFVTSEPIAAKKIGLDVTTFLIADSGYNPYATVLATSEDFLNENRGACEAMLQAVREGWRSYLDDPSAGNTKMRGLNPTMDADTFSAAAAAQKPLIETSQMKSTDVGSMTAERWDALARQLSELKVIDRAPAGADCFADLSK